MKRLCIPILVGAVLMLGGCKALPVPMLGRSSTLPKLQEISIGMDKQQVVQRLGDPIVVRGAVRNKFNETIEVWEYELFQKHGIGIVRFEYFWLYFVDHKLSQWGKAGDWKEEADRIYEVRFNPPKKLKK